MIKPKQTIVTYHTLDHNEAKAMIQDYIRIHPGAMTSKIIDSLRINPEQAVAILNELENNQLIYSTEVGAGPRKD
ncbi:MAG TPA: hypothetical protein VE130_10570 [Nitrososphaeraceae archaeon]|nr:hypothetical protein [Nitrososphaeraceae archaeon]